MGADALDPALVEARLRAYYAKHNPGNTQNIAEIVRKFSGRESKLAAKLHKKYGAAPDFTTPADTSATRAPTEQPPVAAAATQCQYQRDFHAYSLPKSSGGALDFRSAQFDALQALRAPSSRVHVPVASAHPLDNIQKCRHLLPESDVNYQKVLLRPKKPSPSADTTTAKSRTKAPAPPSLFEQLADTYLDGPFTVLRRCFLERRRVLVVVRRVNSVRGTCTGFLKAFDKHLNLVLLDVALEYVPLACQQRMERELREGKRVDADAVFSVANPRRNRRLLAGAGGTQRDYAKQLFVRGDNVVSVSALASSTHTSRPVAPRSRTTVR